MIEEKIRGHVLIVDDEFAARELLKTYLNIFGLRVTVCENGKEAVEFYQKNQDDVDLVSLDLNMPVMNGFECYRQLRQIKPTVKVVVVSGMIVDESVMQELLREGVLAFIPKIFDLMELFERFKSAMGGNGKH